MGKLHPVEIPKGLFNIWSMDFITDLPVSWGFNSIYTCGNKFIKTVELQSCFVGEEQLTAKEVAMLFFNGVVCTYGFTVGGLTQPGPPLYNPLLEKSLGVAKGPCGIKYGTPPPNRWANGTCPSYIRIDTAMCFRKQANGRE